MFFKKINVIGIVMLIVSCVCLLISIVFPAAIILSGIKAKNIFWACSGLFLGELMILGGIELEIFDPIRFFRKEDLIKK